MGDFLDWLLERFDHEVMRSNDWYASPGNNPLFTIGMHDNESHIHVSTPFCHALSQHIEQERSMLTQPIEQSLLHKGSAGSRSVELLAIH